MKALRTQDLQERRNERQASEASALIEELQARDALIDELVQSMALLHLEVAKLKGGE